MSAFDTIVVGAGVVGLTTARALVQTGRRVLVVEAERSAGLGASFGNGALMTPSMSAPWNAPGVSRQLPSALLSSSGAFSVKWRALPSLSAWGVRFLRNSTPTRHARATAASFALARYSTELMRREMEAFGFAFDASASGSLKVFRDAGALEAASERAAMLGCEGLRYDALTAARAIEVEPCLAECADSLAGALWFPDDIVADAFQFCQGLAKRLVSAGAEIRYGEQCSRIILEEGAVDGAVLAARPVRSREVVVCAGWSSLGLMRQVGVNLPIAPVKGYSLTLDAGNLDGVPKVAVVDDAMHAAVTPLGGRLRVVGTADFAGGNMAHDPRRLENLRGFLRALYPSLAQRVSFEDATAWAGQRPMSADGLPFIGASGLRGLWVNSGHGHLGWTMALGSARILSALMSGQAPDLDPTPYGFGEWR